MLVLLSGDIAKLEISFYSPFLLQPAYKTNHIRTGIQ